MPADDAVRAQQNVWGAFAPDGVLPNAPEDGGHAPVEGSLGDALGLNQHDTQRVAGDVRQAVQFESQVRCLFPVD